jgi:hypothetical protein
MGYTNLVLLAPFDCRPFCHGFIRRTLRHPLHLCPLRFSRTQDRYYETAVTMSNQTRTPDRTDRQFGGNYSGTAGYFHASIPSLALRAWIRVRASPAQPRTRVRSTDPQRGRRVGRAPGSRDRTHRTDRTNDARCRVEWGVVARLWAGVGAYRLKSVAKAGRLKPAKCVRDARCSSPTRQGLRRRVAHGDQASPWRAGGATPHLWDRADRTAAVDGDAWMVDRGVVARRHPNREQRGNVIGRDLPKFHVQT